MGHKTNMPTKDDDSNSSTDALREELPWEEREEKLINEIIADCEAAEVVHEAKSKRCKMFYVLFGLPAIILPMVAALLSEYLSTENKMSVSVVLVFASMLSAIQQFFNFGKKAQTHSEFSGRFSELALSTRVEIVKPKRFRVACDVFLERVSRNMIQLKNSAPT
jgi:hypothetical protein